MRSCDGQRGADATSAQVYDADALCSVNQQPAATSTTLLQPLPSSDAAGVSAPASPHTAARSDVAAGAAPLLVSDADASAGLQPTPGGFSPAGAPLAPPTTRRLLAWTPPKAPDPPPPAPLGAGYASGGDEHSLDYGNCSWSDAPAAPCDSGKEAGDGLVPPEHADTGAHADVGGAPRPSAARGACAAAQRQRCYRRVSYSLTARLPNAPSSAKQLSRRWPARCSSTGRPASLPAALLPASPLLAWRPRGGDARGWLRG